MCYHDRVWSHNQLEEWRAAAEDHLEALMDGLACEDGCPCEGYPSAMRTAIACKDAETLAFIRGPYREAMGRGLEP